MGIGQVKSLIREALLYTAASGTTAIFKYCRLNSRPIEFAGFAGVGIDGVDINAAAISFGVGHLGEYFAAHRKLLFVRRRGTT